MAGRSGAAQFDGTLYAENTAHHRAFDEAVLQPLGLRQGARVLDLGCGVGDLTARVADVVLDEGRGLVVGIDLSASNIEVAQQRWARPGLQLRVGALQRLPEVVPENGFDAVMSVATLHWVPWSDHPALLEAVRERLTPGGVLRIDMGGEGQIAAARAVLDPLLLPAGAVGPWCFPHRDAYAELLDGAGLAAQRCRLVKQRRAIPDAKAFEGWLRSQVLPAYEPWLPGDDRREPLLADIVDRCARALRRDDGSFDQDYVRLDVVASRASCIGPDDVAARVDPGADASTSGGLAVSPLPTEFAQLADAILVAQQRIQGADLPDDVTVRLSRSVRRAVRTSRFDLARAHLALARLHGEMDALGC